MKKNKLIVILLLIVLIVYEMFFHNGGTANVFGDRCFQISKNIAESKKRGMYLFSLIPLDKSDTFYYSAKTYLIFNQVGFVEKTWLNGRYVDETYEYWDSMSRSVFIPIEAKGNVRFEFDKVFNTDTSISYQFFSSLNNDLLLSSSYKDNLFDFMDSITSLQDTVTIICYKGNSTWSGFQKTDSITRFRFIVEKEQKEY